MKKKTNTERLDDLQKQIDQLIDSMIIIKDDIENSHIAQGELNDYFLKRLKEGTISSNGLSKK